MKGIKDLVYIRYAWEGHYSWAEASVSVFVPKSWYEENKVVIDSSQHSFYELDWKHSEALADVEVVFVNEDNITSLIKLSEEDDDSIYEIEGIEIGEFPEVLDIIEKYIIANSTTDIQWNNIVVGDEVVYCEPCYSVLEVGRVAKITNTWVSISLNKGSRKTMHRKSSQICKIN